MGIVYTYEDYEPNDDDYDSVPAEKNGCNNETNGSVRAIRQFRFNEIKLISFTLINI